jgi:hypothetical protein
MKAEELAIKWLGDFGNPGRGESFFGCEGG